LSHNLDARFLGSSPILSVPPELNKRLAEYLRVLKMPCSDPWAAQGVTQISIFRGRV
jgi:hypothetical protein